MLLDWLIKLKRSSPNCLFPKGYQNVSDMEYFIRSSMFRHFNVYNIVEKPDRMYLPGTLGLLTFISKQLVFIGHIYSR